MLIATIAVGAVLLAGCVSAHFAHLTKVEQVSPAAAECGECHIAIYNEWKTSRHAQSYTSTTFAAASGDRTFTQCLPCHVPDSVFGDRPKTRTHRMHEGVTCVTCHLVDGKMAGPLAPSAAVLPHPVDVRPEFYREAKFCGKCHESTYREISAQADAPACQQCHMLPIRRKNTQSADAVSRVLVKLEDENDARAHHFSVEQINAPADWLTIDVRFLASDADGQRVVVTLKSNLPHQVPTGDFGKRRAVLRLFSLDAGGRASLVSQVEFMPRLKSALQPHKPWRRIFALPADTNTLKVEFQRVDDTPARAVWLGGITVKRDRGRGKRP